MGISIPQLLILLVIVLLLFGTRRLRNLGSDLGSAIKGFKKAVNDEDQDSTQANVEHLDNVNGEQTKQQTNEQSTEQQNK